MCSGLFSSSAKRANAARTRSKSGWATSSSTVRSLWTIAGPGTTAQSYPAGRTGSHWDRARPATASGCDAVPATDLVCRQGATVSRYRTEDRIPTVTDALNGLRVDELKARAAFLSNAPVPPRKGQLVALLSDRLG